MRVEVISVDFEEVRAGACFVFLARQNSSKKSRRASSRGSVSERIERLESGLFGVSDSRLAYSSASLVRERY